MILRNWSVRIGGLALLFLLVIALAAPWLGTVDPTLFDAASRDLRPGEAGEITTLEGESVKHVFLMGSDSFGRDIYSRVLYGTRVSLMVGLAAAALAVLIAKPRQAATWLSYGLTAYTVLRRIRRALTTSVED